MWTAENKTKQKCQCGRKCFATLLVETRTDTFKNALQRPICSIEHSGSISTPSSVGWDVVHCCITLQHEIQQFLFPAHSGGKRHCESFNASHPGALPSPQPWLKTSLLVTHSLMHQPWCYCLSHQSVQIPLGWRKNTQYHFYYFYHTWMIYFNNKVRKIRKDTVKLIRKEGLTRQGKASKIVKSIITRTYVSSTKNSSSYLIIIFNYFSPLLSCRHCVQGLYL